MAGTCRTAFHGCIPSKPHYVYMQRALHVNILLCAAALAPPLDLCVVYCSVMFVALDTHKRERVVVMRADERPCKYCTTRLYRCRRRRDLHERSCGQHYEPHETSVIAGEGESIDMSYSFHICTPESACEHITCFCSNGLRIVPRANAHRCSDCGEVVDTVIPPYNCCCHQEKCVGLQM